MRVLGSDRGSLRGALLPWLVGALVLLALVTATLWARQQEQRARAAEVRAEVAEAERAVLQASLTAIVRAQAVASATAATLRAADPGPALERALSLVFAVYQEPSQARQRALADAMSPAAIGVFKTETDRLTAQGLRLGGQSSYNVEVLSATASGTDRAQVRTRERWVYDERDQADTSVRCLREESEQTYTLRRAPASGGWLVDSVELGYTRRTDC